jgi:CRISPR-associated protein Cas5d
MKVYSLGLEVSGPLAMWARPDTGATPTSYPAPTWSAAKGLLESVAFLSSGEAWLHPVRVEMCRHRDAPGGTISFQRYTTNYGGPLRLKLNDSMQVFATVLSNVCYRIHAEVRGERGREGRNPRHHLQDMFERRLRQGKCFRTPALGWREFTCDYWGAFRDDWVVDDAIDLEIPSMLSAVWDRPYKGHYVSRFVQSAHIAAGVLTYAE